MKPTVVTGCILSLLVAGLVHAQTMPVLTADIPFDFYVGSKWMPAGEYRVEGVNTLLRLFGVENKEAGLVFMYGVSARETPETGRLVFTRYENGRTFLTRVWHPYSNLGGETVKTRLERESVTSTLVAGHRPVTVVVLATVLK